MTAAPSAQDAQDQQVQNDTRNWVHRAVIGLNLCPFAKAVQSKGQVRYAISHATRPKALLADLERELQHLVASDAAVLDTTLLIAPRGFADFLAFHALLQRADQLLQDLGLEGELQIASLHPHYQFADTEPDDISNYTNRAPHPTLHLLREASVERAVAAFPDPAAIYQTNIATMQRLGARGWQQLQVGATALDTPHPEPGMGQP